MRLENTPPCDYTDKLGEGGPYLYTYDCTACGRHIDRAGGRPDRFAGRPYCPNCAPIEAANFDRPQTEQPMPTPGRESVTDAVMRLLEQRKAKGIATYGTSLMSHNGRDAEWDKIEELCDALQYAMQAWMERRDYQAEIAELTADRDAASRERNRLQEEVVGLRQSILSWARVFAGACAERDEARVDRDAARSERDHLQEVMIERLPG